MFLDHDLDQRDSISSDEVNTGYKFAKELINYYSAKERLHKPVVYVHSLNPVGSENMMNILKDNLFDIPIIDTLPFLSSSFARVSE